MNCGAGGLAISPSFATYCFVGRQHSPVFRMVDEAIEYLCHLGELAKELNSVCAGLPVDENLIAFESSLQRLQQRQMALYVTGSASPYDVDGHGDNLLHVIEFQVAHATRDPDTHTDAFEMLLKMVNTTIFKLQQPYNAFNDIIEALTDFISFLVAFALNDSAHNENFSTALGPFVSFAKEIGLLFQILPLDPWRMLIMESVVHQLCES